MIRNGFINYLHRRLGKYGSTTRFALMVRNQCNAIIRYHLAESANANINGERWLVKTLAGEIDSFLDVGANVGDWTDMLLSNTSTQTKGILFEPSQHALKKLYGKFKNNKSIEIIEAAISNEIGELSFFEEPEAGETSSLIHDHSNSSATQRPVRVSTIDAELKIRQLASIDFLKIDTEGYDLHVLKGASDYLKNQRINIIQFEYNTPWALAGSTLAEAYQLLQRCGYKVFLLKSGGLYKIDYDRYGEYYGYSNFVAVSPKIYPKVEAYVQGNI